MDFGQFFASQIFIGLLTAVGVFHAPSPAVLPAHTTSPASIQKSTPPSVTTAITTPSPTLTPTPTLVPTATPTPIRPTPTNTPVYHLVIPNKALATPTPLPYKDPPAQINTNASPSFVCNCAKTCGNMSSCAEAQYQLNNCGCSARDADHDGIACDSQCQ